MSLHHLWRKLLYHHTVLDNLLHKARTHHFASIGNGVVERQGGYWWYLCLVADAHPWQGCLAPVYPLPPVVLLRHPYLCTRRAYEWQVQVCGQSRSVYTLNEFLWLVMVVVVNNPAHSDVRTYLKRSWKRYCSVATASPVVVLHLSAVHRPYTSTCLHSACGVHNTIVECYEDGCCLEH